MSFFYLKTRLFKRYYFFFLLDFVAFAFVAGATAGVDAILSFKSWITSVNLFWVAISKADW